MRLGNFLRAWSQYFSLQVYLMAGVRASELLDNAFEQLVSEYFEPEFFRFLISILLLNSWIVAPRTGIYLGQLHCLAITRQAFKISERNMQCTTNLHENSGTKQCEHGSRKGHPPNYLNSHSLLICCQFE